MVRLARLLATGFAVFASSTLAADSWTHAGIEGGEVYHLVARQPGVVYAGTFFGGVYRTTDRAAHWQGINSGFDFGETLDFIAADPTNPSVLYAGGGGDGTTVQGTTVSKSTDGGAHWFDASSGLSGGFVSGFAVDPFTPQTLYCGVVGLPYSGIFKTTNGGSKWLPADEGLPKDHLSGQLPSVYAIVADPQTHQRIYALTGAGLMISVDGAATWTAGGGNFGNLQFASFTTALVRDSGGDLFVVTSNGLFRSTDSGAHFVSIGTGLPQGGALGFAADPGNPSVLFAGGTNQIFKSTNTGAGWTESDSGLGNCGKVEALVIDAGSSSVVYAGTDTGAFVSTDSGATWKSADAGLFATRVSHVALDAAGDTILAGSDTGPWLSTNGGAGWKRLSEGLPAGISSAPVAVFPDAPGALLIASRPAGSSDKPAIYRSTDSGASWQKVYASTSCFSIASLETDAANPSRAFGACQASSGIRLLSSTDAGGSWREKSVVAGGVAIAVGGNPSTLLISDAGGFQASTDGGTTFHAVHIPGLAGFTLVKVAAIGGGPPGLLYASAPVSTGVGVFRSTDAGLHWSNIGAGLPADLGSFSAMAADPENPDIVYGATQTFSFESAPSMGFFRSTDRGATWEALETGLDPDFGVSTLRASSDGRLLFAGTTGNGLLLFSAGTAGRGGAARGISGRAPVKVGRRP